jgi:hypothetical protein
MWILKRANAQDHPLQLIRRIVNELLAALDRLDPSAA